MHTPLLLTLLVGCGGFADREPPDINPWVGDPDPTPTPQATWNPPLAGGLVPGPDGGWVATAGQAGWAELTLRAGGKPFPGAAVILYRGPSALWRADLPDRVEEARSHGRYVALVIEPGDGTQLPADWPTTLAPDPGFPDGLLSLIQPMVVPSGDDDTVGDDDSGGDDDSASLPEAIPDGPPRPDWFDPEWGSFFAELVDDVATRLGDVEGIAFVVLTGPGVSGDFRIAEEGGLSGGRAAAFAARLAVLADSFEGSFPGVPLVINSAVFDQAPEVEEQLQALVLDRRLGQHGDCFGACGWPDWSRLPDGGGTPYPPENPWGGFWPGAVGGPGAVFVSGAEGGPGGWRASARAGTWDLGSWGTVEAHFDEQLDGWQRYAPPAWVAIADEPCLSEWALRSSPTGGACDPQDPGPPWAPLQERGAELGARYSILEIRGPESWDAAATLDFEIDLRNGGGAASPMDRPLSVAFFDAAGDLLAEAEAVLPAPLSDLGPGEVATATAFLDGGAILPSAGARFDLAVRIPDPRAWGGGLPWPHAGATEDGWLPVASWMAP